MCAQDSAEYGLRVAVLLHGPQGSGRATAAMAAAIAIGAHVIPYSCHELKVSLKAFAKVDFIATHLEGFFRAICHA